jgi:thiamine-phosphate pyrophosphorylase
LAPLVLPRLYAILDLEAMAGRRLSPLDLLDIWLDAGVSLIQIRAKRLASGPLLALVDQALAKTRPSGAHLIVNDRADLARLAGADGVHLGQGDLPTAAARDLLGPSALIGRSTHNVPQIETACHEPIGYLAIGPVFATASKANPDPVVGLAGVRDAVDRAVARTLPVVAIGGITSGRAPAVIGAGAAAVAVISDLVGDDRPAAAARVRAYLRALA